MSDFIAGEPRRPDHPYFQKQWHVKLPPWAKNERYFHLYAPFDPAMPLPVGVGSYLAPAIDDIFVGYSAPLQYGAMRGYPEISRFAVQEGTDAVVAGPVIEDDNAGVNTFDVLLSEYNLAPVSLVWNVGSGFWQGSAVGLHTFLTSKVGATTPITFTATS